MPGPCTHSERDTEVFRLLSRVRILSTGQLARFAFQESKNPEEAAASWARRMEARGRITRHLVLAKQTVPSKVLAQWIQEDPPPGFQNLSRELGGRWKGSAVSTPVLRLSGDETARRGLVSERLPRASETTHDLQLAEFAMRFHSQILDWRSEKEITQTYRGVIPDAEVEFVGTGWLAVEGGGSSYSAERLESFHNQLTPQLGEKVRGYLIV